MDVLLSTEYMAIESCYTTLIVRGEYVIERSETNRTGVVGIEVVFAEDWKGVYEGGNTVLDGEGLEMRHNERRTSTNPNQDATTCQNNACASLKFDHRIVCAELASWDL
jgi:hypothetical protein